MKSEQVPASDNYQDYLLDYLKKNPQLAAAYLTATLEEENPEPELLLQAISQVYHALLDTNEQNLNNLLDSSEVKTIHKFVDLLQTIGFKINISLVSPSEEKSNLLLTKENKQIEVVK